MKTTTSVELKYCERCGGLWLREAGSAQVYCARCLPLLDDWPAPSKRSFPKLPVAAPITLDDIDFEIRDFEDPNFEKPDFAPHDFAKPGWEDPDFEPGDFVKRQSEDAENNEDMDGVEDADGLDDMAGIPDVEDNDVVDDVHGADDLLSVACPAAGGVA